MGDEWTVSLLVPCLLPSGEDAVQSQVQPQLPAQEVAHQPGDRYPPLSGGGLDGIPILCGDGHRKGIVIF